MADGTALCGIAKPSGRLLQGRGESDFRPLGAGEVDARENADWRRSLLMHSADPGGCVFDECLAGGGGVDTADETVDEVEIQDGVVGAEAEGGVGHGGGNVGRVSGSRLCGDGLTEDGSSGGEEEK